MWKKSIVMAGIIAMFGIGAARADNLAYATSATVLRTSPSTKSHAVASIPANAELTIGHCTQGWCFAHLGGASGYVLVSRLDFNNDDHGTVVEQTYVEPNYVYPEYYPGPFLYGPGLYVGGFRHDWHGGPGMHAGPGMHGPWPHH